MQWNLIRNSSPKVTVYKSCGELFLLLQYKYTFGSAQRINQKFINQNFIYNINFASFIDLNEMLLKIENGYKKDKRFMNSKLHNQPYIAQISVSSKEPTVRLY